MFHFFACLATLTWVVLVPELMGLSSLAEISHLFAQPPAADTCAAPRIELW